MFKEICQKINSNKKNILALVLLNIFFIFLFNINFVFADDAANPVMVGIATVIGWIAFLISYVIGYVATVIIDVLIWVAQFNNIIGVTAVSTGWVIVRDLCNMFFILILLVIAFATILRQENYSAKKLLPKLLIMAVLINFSKTICGLIIDFSQVIMLTFVNGFASSGAGHFVQMFQMNKYFSMSEVSDQAFKGGSGLAVAAGIIMGVIAMIVTVITLLVMLAVLVMRIIMLWVYVILSPIAFLAAAFPAGQKYSSQWWSEFSKQVVVGPVLAFFIWLALLTAGTSSTDLGTKVELGSSKISVVGQSVQSPNALFNTVNFQSYIITLALLIGGLMVTQQLGGMAGSMAGSAVSKIKTAGVGAAMLPLRGAKTLGGYGIDKLHEKTGVDLNVARVWTGIQEKRAEIKKKRYGRGMIKASEMMREKGIFKGLVGMTGTPGQAWEQLTTAKGWGQRLRGGKRSKDKIEGEGGLAEQRENSKKAIEKITQSEEYNNALELSQAQTPQQRHDLSIEQGKLVTELDELSKAIEVANRKISLAKTSKDEVSEKMATDELESLKAQKQSKINIIAENEGMLKKLERSLKDIFKAQDLVESKNNEINKHKEDIETINDQILKYKPIMDFDAIAMQGGLEAEEMKKVDHIKDREELASMLRDAMKNGDKTRFSAIALKLAKDGNENDGVLNNLGLKSNAEGLNKMAESISSKWVKDANGKDTNVKNKNYVGFTDQEAKALGMKISYAAEANNHWGTARAFTMQDGRYRNSTSKEQAQAAISEIAKMDPQNIAKALNRLGYGGETPDGKFELDEFGLALLKAIGPRLALPTSMGRFNPNAFPRLAEKQNIELMVKVGVAPEFISALQGKAATPTLKALDAVDQVFNSKIKTT